MAEAERAAYANAYANEKPFNLSGILDPVERQFAGRTTGIASEMRKAAELFSSKTPGRPPQFEPFKRLEHFQEAKIDLDQMIAASKNTGAATPLTRQLTLFKNKIMDEVSRTNPAWREANDLFAEDALSRRLFKDVEKTGFRITPDSRKGIVELERYQAALKSRTATPEQKKTAQGHLEMARDALGNAVNMVTANKGETHDHVAKFLTPAAQQLINAVLGKNDAAKFTRALRAEQEMTRTYRSLGGSQTTPLRETINELNGPPLLASALDMANPKALVQALITRGAAKYSEKRNNRMVPMMVEADPIKQLKLLRDIETMRKARVGAGTPPVQVAPSVSLPIAGLLQPNNNR